MDSAFIQSDDILPPAADKFFFAVALRPNARHGLLILEVSRSQTMHQSAGLLWTSDQLDAETST